MLYSYIVLGWYGESTTNGNPRSLANLFSSYCTIRYQRSGVILAMKSDFLNFLGVQSLISKRQMAISGTDTATITRDATVAGWRTKKRR